MTTVSVRPIADDDIPHAVAILIAGSREPDAEDTQNFDDYASAVAVTRRAGGDVLVATSDGTVVGVCQVLVFAHFQHQGGWCAEIESVHVREDCRRRGVGAALLAAAEAHAGAAGCYRIQLTSHDSRVEAHRFYEATGFEATHVGFKKVISREPSPTIPTHGQRQGRPR